MRSLALTLAGAVLLSIGAPGARAEAPSCWPGEPGSDPALCPPNDPRFARRWEFKSDIPAAIDRSKVHPRELELGSIGFSLDRAWQWSTGRDDVVIAVLDSGIRWDYPDLVRKLYLNAGELPVPEDAESHDRNRDGIFNIDDYAADSRVGDRNHNGLLDPQDLILAFSDCRDDDHNGYPDDISGYDFFAGSHCALVGGDNDPSDDTDFGHGTGIASTAAAETNNALRDAGVCPRCRVLPVRVGDSFVVDANQFARGVVFATEAGASVIASALGSYNNTPTARRAVDFAYEHGVPLIASAADEFSYHHNYPSLYNHTLYVNAIRHNHVSDYRKASTFWGLNPCTNFGARVWISVPAVSCSSGATSRLAGVVGLLQSVALDAGLGPLHAEEIYQVLRATADDLDNTSPDWGDLRFPARPGFDQLFGYGRLNALRAVLAVREGDIPPIVDLWNPRWFEIISPRRRQSLPISGSIRVPRASRATYRLDYALGVEPAAEAYREVSRGTVTAEQTGKLGVLDFTKLPVPGGPSPRNRKERDRFSVTLRLQVVDDRGRVAEARRSFFVFHDPTWMEQFPVDLKVSGEASPVLVDLDGDGRDEIVLPTSDGYLRIYRWRAGGIRLLLAPLDERPRLGDRGRRETAIRGAVVGDLFGNGAQSVVMASREGSVYAFSARGERLGGFPVRVPTRPVAEPSPRRRVESGILSRPLLANLDGKPGAEIVVTSLDGHLYVWRNDGSLLDGFPVAIRNPSRPDHLDKIVSSPAVGDVDGDGRPEILLGSNGHREGLAAAYAVRARGMLDPAGPLLPGWPVEIPALRSGLLPTLASGIQMAPLLVDADGDGDQEILLYAVTGASAVLVDHAGEDGPAIINRYEMAPHEASAFRDTTFLAGTGSALLSDTDGDGTSELYAPLLPFRMLTLRSKPGVPLDVPLALGGWNVGRPVEGRGTPMRAGYPRKMEDLMVFASPAAADVDGDGIDEVLMGSGGYLLHAFRGKGGEPPGFPRFTGGWIFSTPAVGDLDGDGRNEIVAVTREGYLFAWKLGHSQLSSNSSMPPPGAQKN